MKYLKNILASSLLSLLFLVLLLQYVFNFNLFHRAQEFIPPQQWPTFDRQPPYLINGPLWVGFDTQQNLWRYVKIKAAEKPGETERGLNDPGDPAQWNSETGETGYFTGKLDQLPGGTHINNRYNPATVAARYKVDDVMIRVGDFWVDKYESSLLFVDSLNNGNWIDDPKSGDISSLNNSATGFNFPPNAIAVSQRRRGTSGLTYFASEQAAINNGKHLLRNEQWQAAAAGTSRTDATGMTPGGEEWKLVLDKDISRYGLVGCVGSLWEWTASWGQYGEHYSGTPTNWYNWPGAGSYTEWDGKYNSYGDDIVINVSGTAYTRQDSARYAPGLPAALVRGGSWGDHNRAGVFALIADGAPTYYGFEVGFRCVK